MSIRRLIFLLLVLMVTACGATPTPTPDNITFVHCVKVIGLTDGVILGLTNGGVIASQKFTSDHPLEIGDIVKFRFQDDLLIILTDNDCG